MASAGAIRAGAAFVELQARDGGMTATLRAAEARVKTFGRAATAVGRTLGDAGQAAIRFGVGLAIPLGLAAKTFASFESSMSGVKAILQEGGGFDASQFEALSKEAMRLGAETKFSAGEAAAAMEVLAKAGFNAQTILAATGNVLDLAAAGGLDLASAAGVVTTAMKSMAIPVEDLTAVTDTLAKASTMAYTDVALLGEGLAKIGPDASRLGISFNDTVAALMLLNDAGRRGEEAGVGLRSMLMSLVNPTKEAEAALADLGVKLWEGGKFRGLPALFESLDKASKTRTPEEMSKRLGDIFTNVGGSSAAAIMNRVAQGANFAGLSKTLDAPGAGSRMAQERMNNLAGSVETLMSNLEGLAVVVGGAVSPVLREWGAMLGGVVNSVATWAAANPEVFQGLARISLAAVAGGAALMALGGVLKVVGVAIGGFGLVLGPLIAVYLNPTFLAIRWVASGLAMLAGASEGGRAAMAAFGSFLGGLWSDMVAGASAAFESVRATAVQVWPTIAEALKAGDLSNALGVAGAAINLEMVKLTNALMGTWNTFFDWLKNKFASAHELAMQGPAYRGAMQAFGAIGSASKALLADEKPPGKDVYARLERYEEYMKRGEGAKVGALMRDRTPAMLRAVKEAAEARYAALLADDEAGLGDTAEARARALAIARKAGLELQRREEKPPDPAAARRAEDALLREMGMDADVIAAEGVLDRRLKAAREAERERRMVIGGPDFVGPLMDPAARRRRLEIGGEDFTGPLSQEQIDKLNGAARGAGRGGVAGLPEGEVKGSFNALVAGMMGPSNLAQRQVNIAERQLEKLGDIDRRLEQGGGRFG